MSILFLMAGANLISGNYMGIAIIHETLFLMDEWYFLTNKH